MNAAIFVHGAMAVIAGILLSPGSAGPPWLALWPLAASVVWWKLALDPVRFRVWVGVSLLGMALGFVRHLDVAGQPMLDEELAAQGVGAQEELQFHARLLRAPERSPFYRRSMDVELLSARELGGGELEGVAGLRVVVAVADRWRIRNLRAGDVVEFHGVVRAPRQAAHPGAPDGRTWLRHAGRMGSIEGRHESLRVQGNERPGGLVLLAEALRERFSTTYREYLSEPVATLGMGAGLGMRGEVWGRDWGEEDLGGLFARSGISHLLAVSGLHVGILAGALVALGGALRVPRRWSLPVILVALLVFLVMTGARPPTVRAVVMASCALCMHAWMGRRPAQAVGLGMAAAAILLLLHNPDLLFAPGFQLSFVAVLSLVCLAPRISEAMVTVRGWRLLGVLGIGAVYGALVLADPGRWLRLWVLPGVAAAVWLALALIPWDARSASRFHLAWLPRPVRLLVAAQAAIQIGCIVPLSAWYFGHYAVAGNVVNLVVIPLAGLFVPAVLGMGLAGLVPVVGGWLALPIGWAVEVLGRAVFLAADWLSRPFPYPLVARPQPGEMLAYFTLLAAALVPWPRVWRRLRGMGAGRGSCGARAVPAGAVLVGAAVAVALVFGTLDLRRMQTDTLLVVDGYPSTRGNAKPVALWFDAGRVVVFNPPAPRYWDRVVAPPLRLHGHTRIDAVVPLARVDLGRLEPLTAAAAGFGRPQWIDPADPEAMADARAQVVVIQSGHPRAHPRFGAAFDIDGHKLLLVPDADAAAHLVRGGAEPWRAFARALLPAPHSAATTGEVADDFLPGAMDLGLPLVWFAGGALALDAVEHEVGAAPLVVGKH